MSAKRDFTTEQLLIAATVTEDDGWYVTPVAEELSRRAVEGDKAAIAFCASAFSPSYIKYLK